MFVFDTLFEEPYEYWMVYSTSINYDDDIISNMLYNWCRFPQIHEIVWKAMHTVNHIVKFFSSFCAYISCRIIQGDLVNFVIMLFRWLMQQCDTLHKNKPNNTEEKRLYYVKFACMLVWMCQIVINIVVN